MEPAASNTTPPPLFMGIKKRRPSSADKRFCGDHMGIGNNVLIQKMMQKAGDTEVVFADSVVKVNKRTKMQERILLITENAIYNVDKNVNYKVKRRILIKDVGSIVVSTFADNFFLIRVPSEYDYFLVSSKKTEIILRLLTTYQRLTGEPLEVEFLNNFEYAAEIGLIREVEFTQGQGGVNTHVTSKKK